MHKIMSSLAVADFVFVYLMFKLENIWKLSQLALGRLCSLAIVLALASGIGSFLCKQDKNEQPVIAPIFSALSAMIALIGLLGMDPPPFSYTFITASFCVIAATGIVLSYQVIPSEESVGKQLGFSPPPGPMGNKGMKAVIRGMEVLLDIVNDKDAEVKVLCRVQNLPGSRLVIYRKSALGLSRPLGPLPPVIEKVPYWDWYVVHGEPADLVAGALREARKNDDNVFQDKYGFTRIELDKDGFKSLFWFNSLPEVARIKKMIDETVELALKFN